MVQPGEGERGAALGLHAQYDIAAELTLANMRHLEWVKVADPEAGKADDFQLATTRNHLHALQVRWATFPSSYGIGKLIGGTNPFIRDLADAWSRLRKNNPVRTIRVHLVSNNIPAFSQTIQKQSGGMPGHFAAFIARGLKPLQTALRHDPAIDVSRERGYIDWAEVWEKLRTAAALDQDVFWNFITDFELNLGVSENAFPETDRSTPAQLADLADVSSFFFEIVSDPSHVVTLSKAELLDKLGWTSRLSYRNPHVFPVPAAYEPNEQAVSDLLAAMESHSGGYLGLVAPAGAGKSTLLTATDLPARRVVHYYAYTPEAPDPSTGRGESENFFFDVVMALDAQGLHTRDVVDPRDRLDLKARFLRQLEEAGTQWKEAGERTIIIVDGLDHIPREQSPARSLIDDLPDPGQLPEGVFLIVGTQTLDVLPVSIKASLSAANRTINVPPLTDETVLAIAASTGPGNWLQPGQKQSLLAAAEGHPLALTYLLEELTAVFVDPDQGPTAEAYERVDSILKEGAEYKGDIEARYEGYWHRIASHANLHRLLGIAARLRPAISLEWLMTWNDPEVVHHFAHTAAPFFIRDRDSWAFIHNSFRLFLRRKTAMVGDEFNEERHRSLHAEAADICAEAEGRWVSYRDEELAQRLHAEQHERVLQLAAPEVLRSRLDSFAPPGAVQTDVNLALRSAALVGDAKAVLRLALMKFELELRSYVLEPHDVAMTLIKLGEYETALKHVVVGRELRIGASKALEAAARLANADRIADAGQILRAVGSLRSLLERKDAHRLYDHDTAELIQWWVAVHARLRPLDDVFDELDRELPASPGDRKQDEAGNAETVDTDTYRRAALWQLSAEVPGSNDAAVRSKVMLALSEMEPAAAASVELEIETDGSLAATLDRVDAALTHLNVKANRDDPTRWPADEIENVPTRIRIKGAELLVELGAYPAATTLIAGCRLQEPRRYGDEEEKRLWRAYRLHRLRHIVGLLDEPDAFEGTDTGLARFVAALTDLAELDAFASRIGEDGDRSLGPAMSVVRQLHRCTKSPGVRDKGGQIGTSRSARRQTSSRNSSRSPRTRTRTWSRFCGSCSWVHGTIPIDPTIGHTQAG